jgi:rod shape-determining protein MreD
MLKNVSWALVFILVAVLLQSTVLSRLALHIYAVPDLALCILVFTAYSNGFMTGQFTGFFSGVIMDFLSAAPLGLNALIRTLIGGITGLVKSTFFLDVIFLPMILCAGATLFKALCFFLLNFLYSSAVPAYTLFSNSFLAELALNTLLAPFMFAFLKLFKFLLVMQRENT